MKKNLDISVCILEKGEAIGSHILSGCLMDPSSLSKLIPDWKERVYVNILYLFIGQPYYTKSIKGIYAFSCEFNKQYFHPLLSYSPPGQTLLQLHCEVHFRNNNSNLVLAMSVVG